MKLTELQEVLILGLKEYELSDEAIATLVAILMTEEQQFAMCCWIKAHRPAPTGVVIRKAAEIASSYNQIAGLK